MSNEPAVQPDIENQIFSDADIAEANRIAEAMENGGGVEIKTPLDVFLSGNAHDVTADGEIAMHVLHARDLLEAVQNEGFSDEDWALVNEAAAEQVELSILTDVDGTLIAGEAPEVVDFEKAIKLFGDTTPEAVALEEALGLDTAASPDGVEVIDRAILLTLASHEIAASETEFDQQNCDDLSNSLADSDPLKQPSVLDIAFAKARLDILSNALMELHYAVEAGRVNPAYYEAARLQTEALFRQFGHEMDYSALGKDHVVVDLSNYRGEEPEPATPEV